MGRHVVSVAALPFIALLWACDGGGPDTDCSDVADACTADEEGQARCNADASGVETCAPSADVEGCFAWTEELCDAAQLCDDPGDAAACVCDNECDAEGVATCDGDELVLCTDVDGCLIEGRTDCTDDGGLCLSDEDPPRCSTCTDGCETLDETRCDGDVV